MTFSSAKGKLRQRGSVGVILDRYRKIQPRRDCTLQIDMLPTEGRRTSNDACIHKGRDRDAQASQAIRTSQLNNYTLRTSSTRSRQTSFGLVGQAFRLAVNNRALKINQDEMNMFDVDFRPKKNAPSGFSFKPVPGRPVAWV